MGLFNTGGPEQGLLLVGSKGSSLGLDLVPLGITRRLLPKKHQSLVYWSAQASDTHVPLVVSSYGWGDKVSN